MQPLPPGVSILILLQHLSLYNNINPGKLKVNPGKNRNFNVTNLCVEGEGSSLTIRASSRAFQMAEELDNQAELVRWQSTKK